MRQKRRETAFVVTDPQRYVKQAIRGEAAASRAHDKLAQDDTDHLIYKTGHPGDLEDWLVSGRVPSDAEPWLEYVDPEGDIEEVNARLSRGGEE